MNKKIFAALIIMLAIIMQTQIVFAGQHLEKIQNLPGIESDSMSLPQTQSSETGIMSQSMETKETKTQTMRHYRKPKIAHFSFMMKDDSHKLSTKVDVWVNLNNHKKIKIDYLLPGSGLNTEADFNTNSGKTFVENCLEEYPIVVGITPAEAEYNPENPAHSQIMLSELGVPNHVAEAKKVINFFQKYGLNYDYAVEGHSAGAMVAAMLATELGKTDRHFIELGIHDMALQYKAGTPQAANALASYNAVLGLYENGIYEYSNFVQFKTLADTIRAGYGSADSGVPRGDPLPGNSTVEGLFYFASIHTGWMPGPVTGITGLPDSWYFGDGGYVGGDYQFAADPANDSYNFSSTKPETLFSALDKIKYGAYPTAFERDIMATMAGINVVNWNNIAVPVYWKNTELGFGDVSKIDQGYEVLSKKPGFSYTVKKSFGHADIMFADNAFE